MDKLKLFYLGLGIFSVLFGVVLFLTVEGSGTGATIGISSEYRHSVDLGFAIFFILAGSALLLTQYFNKKVK